ncbi:hypothetical protein DFH01_18120 [Falsiroseomonas bella]|uniref:Ice-binding protein C-terminal domain-containing protein n=1 Tax=Falsiroseomonas bella TaxID=2184016 RepID=A0A317F8R3_9PROT|nr:PEP-CTERM sorting domain-containing protein [Falsiroseomonas bella]PWS35520.1 hypothetical protein DFH01_18120 [Falsiroseomonas bella]
MRAFQRTALLASCLALAAPHAEAAWLFQTPRTEPDYYVRAYLSLTPEAQANGVSFELENFWERDTTFHDLKAAGVLGLSIIARRGGRTGLWLFNTNLFDLRTPDEMFGDFRINITWKPETETLSGSIYVTTWDPDIAVDVTLGYGLHTSAMLGVSEWPCAEGRSPPPVNGAWINGCNIVTLGGTYADVQNSPLVEVPEPGSVALFATALLGMLGIATRRHA